MATQHTVTTEPRQPAVIRPIRDDEERLEAVVGALTDSVEDDGEADPLFDWLDFEALDALVDSSQEDIRVSTVIWDRRVVIESDRIKVYETTRNTAA